MTKIESKHKTIKYSSETIFNFLSDFNNFEELMPSKVSDWTSTKDSCYFSISGIASLGMKIVEKEAFTRIKMIDDGKVPFTFEFIVDIETIDTNSCVVKLTFNAQLNAMLKMVAVNPLKDFLESLLEHLEQHQFEH